jgi:hypothetical protein
MGWKPGQSGNPAGCKPGPSKVAKLRVLLELHADALVDKAVELALARDPQALQLCLERLIPALKPQSPTVRFALAGESLTQLGQAILEATAIGVLTSDQCYK